MGYFIISEYLFMCLLRKGQANGLRYPRWGGRRDAVQPEKGSGVEKAWNDRRIPSVGCTLCWQELGKARHAA
jgi:hypothetical protein